MEKQNQLDFLTALGEEFGLSVTPPVPQEDASIQECCDALWQALGRNITPDTLAKLNPSDVEKIQRTFSSHFECEAPSSQQILTAVANTLRRWPATFTGESA